jgi:hypothetical protein
MRLKRHRTTLLLLLASVAAAGCGTAATPQVSPSSRLVPDPGNPRGKILLSASGAQRIGIQTAPAGVTRITTPKPAASSAGAHKPSAGKASPSAASSKARAGLSRTEVTVPYSAVIYAPSGGTFVFSNPARLTYTEIPITVNRIDGKVVVLARGPKAGTRIVTVGAEELYGVQTGVLAQT